MHDELLRRLNETKTMSIVGMCKNAGKTTMLNWMLSGGHLHGTTNCGDKGNSGTVTTARRMAEAMADPDAPVQLISATSDQLFLDYMDRRDELPTYDGELLMDVHAGGCYTSQGAMKYYNRRNEELLGAAERAAVAADWLGAKPYDRAKLNEVWQRVLWHQFHDDLTGCLLYTSPSPRDS